MIGAALIAEWVVARQESRPQARRLVHGALAVGLGLLGMVAVMKATNEPSVSNKWQYYSAPEKAALLWSEGHSGPRTLWAGLDERLPAAMGICCSDDLDNLTLSGGRSTLFARDFLSSDIIRARAARVNLDLPIPGDGLLIYANGKADLYHLRPKTPFQK
jgi:hypothetical protein